MNKLIQSWPDAAVARPLTGLRSVVKPAVVTCSTAKVGQCSYGTAGEVMLAVNQLSLGRRDPRLRRVKDCFDQAVLATLGSQANVQHQGSTRKGTGLTASSDWDFFVHLPDIMPPVTHRQRMAVVELLKQLLPYAGIDYNIRCGERRVFLWNGSDGSGPLPDVDLVFARFKRDVKRAPKSKALAHSQVAQQVVKYIKRLPLHFTQLQTPKSSLVERAVMELLQLQEIAGRRLMGAEGFDELLVAVLGAIAGAGSAGAYGSALVAAEPTSFEWQAAAKFVLAKKTDGIGWLIV